MTFDTEPLLSGSQARQILAELRGGKKIAWQTLTRLVSLGGLPSHPDPFGGPRSVFLASEIQEWFQARTPKGKP